MNLLIIPLSFFLGAIFKFPGGDCSFSFVPHDPTVVILGSNSSNVSLHWKCNIEEASIGQINVHRYDPENPSTLITLGFRFGSGGVNKISTANFAGRGLFFGSGCEASLLIFNVSVDDGKFRYRAKVSTGDEGADIYSDGIKMLVAVHPRIFDTDPTNKVVAVNESQPFNLSCNASGNPSPTVIWSKTSGSPLQFPDGTTLTVSNASSQHNGTYQCTATNLAGSDTATFVVVVQFPPKITIRPLQQTVCENQPVTFSCNVEEGIPEPKVTWRKNNDATILISSHDMPYNYSIGRPKGHHSGNYSCVATNAAGTEKKIASLHVEIAAKVSFITPNSSYERNTPFTLECSVTGDPSPNVTLLNITDGSVLMNSTTETNHIKLNVSLHNKGIFRCMAKNKCGSESRETTINVYDNPCNRSPCNNGGTCTPIVRSTWEVSYNCNCKSTFWKGKDCNESTCDENPCKNEGKCNRDDGNCSCVGFWIGETCAIASCERKPCNGGECKILGGSVNGECICSKEKRGTYCNLETDNIKETGWEVKLSKVKYQEDYKNVKSIASQQLVLSFLPEMVNESNAEDGKVIAIVEGSVVIHFVLYYNFTMSDGEIEKLLRKAVADGKIGSYEVDPDSLKQPPAPTTPEKKGLQVEIIVLIAVIASILVIVIIVVIIWKVKTRRCRRERKVTNREEHKLNSTFGHAPYVEDGPTVTSHQDKRSKEGKKPVPLYSEVDMPKKSKKKKPGEVLYADLDTFQPNVATEGSNAQQPSKKPEKHQTTDYASITDVIKEEGGKSVKVPIVTSDRNISNNGSTISEP